VRRAPRCFGFARTRWTYALVGQAVPWLQTHSSSAIGRVLRALNVVLRRAREHVHSPDPVYADKRAEIAASLAAARSPPATSVTLFLDEVTIHRQPTVAPAYAERGGACPPAERTLRAEAPTRVLATLDATTGRVVWVRQTRLTVATLVHFFAQLVAAYPDAERIDVVLDNWPVHFHPDLLSALQPQTPLVPFVTPPSWPATAHPAAVARWGAWQLPIRLVLLPTYASWLNPIEKLWRKLRQEVTHLHPWADDLPGLRAAIDAFLDQFALGSPDLLRYTGLLPI